MNIPWEEIKFEFSTPPLLVGGQAMAYYELKAEDSDYDWLVSADDFKQLKKLSQGKLKKMDDDLGIEIGQFEFWITIHGYDLEFWREGAIDEGKYEVISLERLVFMTALVANKPKYYQDLLLLIEKVRG